MFVSREATIFAQNALETVWRPSSARTRWGAHSAAPDSLAEFREGEGMAEENGRAKGGREGKGEKGGCEGREGWGREERKQRKVGLCPTRN